MMELSEKFEKEVTELVENYSKEGMHLSDQITILGYLCLDFCEKSFPDSRIGYTHFLTILIQRIIHDMGDEPPNKKIVIH